MIDFAFLREHTTSCVAQSGNLVRLAGFESWDQPLLSLCVAEFDKLDQLLREVAQPLWDDREHFLGIYDGIPPAVGDVSRPSYHELGFEVSRQIFLGGFQAADILYYSEHRPQNAEAFTYMEHSLQAEWIGGHWDRVRSFLLAFPLFDAARLCSCIEDESHRAERRLPVITVSPAELGKAFGRAETWLSNWRKENPRIAEQVHTKSWKVLYSALPPKVQTALKSHLGDQKPVK